MTINAIKSTNELEIMRSIYAAAYAPPTQGNSNSQNGASTENLEISAVGNLMNAISQMSSTDQSSIKSFMDDLTSSVQNGTFDASTMADSAPSALTSYAEENGIDLTQLVQTLADGPQNNPGVYGPPPPPPPMMSSASSASGTSSTSSLDLSSLENLSSDDKTSLESFLTDLTESVNNGTFDASTMAASAPDSLTNLAEANGVDLTQLIQDMADQIQNNGKASAPPPPPPMMSGMNGLDFSSLENLSSTDQSSLESFITDLTDEVNNGTFDASTMASSAPESLTSFATANGIDLTQLIQDMADEIENNTSASSTSTASSTTAASFPPPPPPMMYGANGSGSSSSDDLSSILLSQFLSGNYSDSTSAAASA
jgi:hypothetical protein